MSIAPNPLLANSGLGRRWTSLSTGFARCASLGRALRRHRCCTSVLHSLGSGRDAEPTRFPSLRWGVQPWSRAFVRAQQRGRRRVADPAERWRMRPQLRPRIGQVPTAGRGSLRACGTTETRRSDRSTPLHRWKPGSLHGPRPEGRAQSPLDRVRAGRCGRAGSARSSPRARHQRSEVWRAREGEPCRGYL